MKNVRKGNKEMEKTNVIITIATKPKPKLRARFNRKTGIAYNPDKNEDYESLIRWHCKQATKHFFEGGICLICNFYFKPPASTPKKKLESYYNATEPYTKKPDLDNLVKAVKDSLNGVLWKDDSQIVYVLAKKRYAQEDLVEIEVFNEL